MRSGDGLIVRVRPQGGMLRLEAFVALAEAARRFGNGQIDLTRRANLQIRGIDEESLTALHGVIGGLGFLDETPESEAVRNLMISPLAGIDPTEVWDVRAIAGELSRELASDTALWALPSKFGFVIDGGGTLTLAEERADIRLAAVRNGSEVTIAIGLDTDNGTEWLGATAPATAAKLAIATARVFLETKTRAPKQRIRDLSPETREELRSRIAPRLGPLPRDPQSSQRATRIGLFDLGAGRYAVGMGTAFGRIETEPFQKFATAVSGLGVTEIRLSPWRALYAAASSRRAAETICEAAANAGFITDPADPLLRIEACPGAPGCASTCLDTRGDGHRLAALLTRSGFTGTVHVSGCAKGCAKSSAADLVLVGHESRYGIVRNGTAQDTPRRTSSFAELAADPRIIFDPAGGGTT
jgi:precorrin-3B synthase